MVNSLCFLIFKVAVKIFLVLFATHALADTNSMASNALSTDHKIVVQKKWPTDESTRKGMESIRQVIAANRVGIDQGQLRAGDYKMIAQAINKNVGFILSICKLHKKADKAFHVVVLSDLNAGTQLMLTSPKVDVQRLGALEVVQALNNYGKYFEHSGWKSPGKLSVAISIN